MIKNTINSYGTVAKFFHWVIGILIIIMLVFGFFLEDIDFDDKYYIHKTFGFAILLLVILRFIWKIKNSSPKYPASIAPIFVKAANLMHYLLYLLMLMLPLSAFLASNFAERPVSFLFLFDLPLIFENKNVELAKKLMEIHGVLAIILSAAICIHFAAAMIHHFYFKDNILKRMLPKF